jgi:hypothetical protein
MCLDGGNVKDLLPKTKVTSVVECPRVGLLLNGATIHIALSDVSLAFNPQSTICVECRNRTVCYREVNRTKFQADIVADSLKVVCPQAGMTMPLSVAQETWAGLENAECKTCPNVKSCLPMALPEELA